MMKFDVFRAGYLDWRVSGQDATDETRREARTMAHAYRCLSAARPREAMKAEKFISGLEP